MTNSKFKIHPFDFAQGASSEVERQNSKFYAQDGYIALVALLVVVAAGLTVGIAVSLSGIGEIQISHSDSQAARAKSLANACLEEGLEKLRNDWVNYSGSLSIDGNSCIINTVVNGGTATLIAESDVEINTQKIEIQVDNNLNVITWQEE